MSDVERQPIKGSGIVRSDDQGIARFGGSGKFKIFSPSGDRAFSPSGDQGIRGLRLQGIAGAGNIQAYSRAYASAPTRAYPHKRTHIPAPTGAYMRAHLPAHTYAHAYPRTHAGASVGADAYTRGARGQSLCEVTLGAPSGRLDRCSHFDHESLHPMIKPSSSGDDPDRDGLIRLSRSVPMTV